MDQLNLLDQLAEIMAIQKIQYSKDKWHVNGDRNLSMGHDTSRSTDSRRLSAIWRIPTTHKGTRQKSKKRVKVACKRDVPNTGQLQETSSSALDRALPRRQEST